MDFLIFLVLWAGTPLKVYFKFIFDKNILNPCHTPATALDGRFILEQNYTIKRYLFYFLLQEKQKGNFLPSGASEGTSLVNGGRKRGRFLSAVESCD